MGGWWETLLLLVMVEKSQLPTRPSPAPPKGELALSLPGWGGSLGSWCSWPPLTPMEQWVWGAGSGGITSGRKETPGSHFIFFDATLLGGFVEGPH